MTLIALELLFLDCIFRHELLFIEIEAIAVELQFPFVYGFRDVRLSVCAGTLRSWL
jgi:hypothetical protein